MSRKHQPPAQSEQQRVAAQHPERATAEVAERKPLEGAPQPSREVSAPVPDRSGVATPTGTRPTGEIVQPAPSEPHGLASIVASPSLPPDAPAILVAAAPPNHPHIKVDAPPVAPLAELQPAVVPARAPVQRSKTVEVRLIWPAVRGAKEDCRANTGIIWTGHGDVQDYPADKWYLLAVHPDVWELVNPADATVAAQARVDRTETPAERLLRLNASQRVVGVDGTPEARRLESERVKALAAQTNTDAVLASPGPSMGRPATEHAPTVPVPEVVGSGVRLAPSTYDEAALAPHTETAAIEAQARHDANVAAGVPDAPADDPLRAVPAHRTAALLHSAKLPPDRRLSAGELESMSDADVFAEGAKRDYVMHPRLSSPNLRAKFLELQATH